MRDIQYQLFQVDKDESSRSKSLFCPPLVGSQKKNNNKVKEKKYVSNQQMNVSGVTNST